MFNPVSTYRLQFHKGFTFNDFEEIIPYLEQLGVSTVYASPIFQATSGSTHGYDTINPLLINPEIGTIEQLRAISKKLKAAGISWLQDIVPNHMAYNPGNIWLMDLLEKGPLSTYKTYFDQSLDSDLFEGPIMVPFLGTDLKEAIDNNELELAWNEQQLVLKYAEHSWPLSMESYRFILNSSTIEQPKVVEHLLLQLHDFEKLSEAAAFAEGFTNFKSQLSSMLKQHEFNKYFTGCLKTINSDTQLLSQIIAQQHYRPCCWQETNHQINYRRFFTVNGLICLSMQHPEVFRNFHQLIVSLVQEGIFQGLRIDHIDGLYDPELYLEQLRQVVGEDTYIVVEKILERGEEMPTLWPVQGNTGYDFLAMVNNLLTNQKNEAAFTGFYQNLVKDSQSVNQQITAKKALILSQQMGGELENLTRLFLASGFLTPKETKSVAATEIKDAIGELLVRFPVYRFYGNLFPLNQQESDCLKGLFKSIRNDQNSLTAAVNALERVMLNNDDRSPEKQQNALNFYQRCMQFSGPLMAKGVEDTLMYTYNRFIGHNEVGDSPEAFGIQTDEYHSLMQTRQQQWPLSLNATATHDTKRGEDVRARLNVLPDIADEWFEAVNEWREMNREMIQNNAPDVNDEYFIYETIIGAYPMPGEDDKDFKDRLNEYLQKTLREAKVHSNWAVPDEEYEKATIKFAGELLNKNRPFWKSFTGWHQKVADFGIVNSLTQVSLKFTSPGISDVYQGCEHWDQSFVDPDNRRPVDYNMRKELSASATEPGVLWKTRFNGQIKVWLTSLLMQQRKKYPLLFAEGDYLPLEVKGKYAGNIVAFARFYRHNWLIIAAPLSIAEICREQKKDILEIDWADTRILLPAGTPEKFENLLTHNKGKHQQQLEIASLFKTLPLALLLLEKPKSDRSSGVLMPASSLPSPFGIGDFGQEARKFADILHRSYQKYWQILPLTPIEAKSQYSPYSSFSSMAGNILFISPQLLHTDGLLTNDDLIKAKLPVKNKVVYADAGKCKMGLFDKAWANYSSSRPAGLQLSFLEFCEREAAWLNNFALYAVLKQQHQDKAWYQWPKEYRFRNKKALSDFDANNGNAIEKEKWLQFIFHRQWHQLKGYCNQLGIRVFGDLPFYVSYDSVDVWSHPEIFSLDAEGNMQYIAGVPPDYFNENGQLWGMPVFKWDKLKEQKYDWWIKRIRKNIELFDLTRLDHFRAFSSYWAVPAGDRTATNGTWEKGPGSDFFNALKKEAGTLPFVAEDLGDIDDDVYNLRDEFNLPGMRVLQFAFGDQLAYSPHIPHNYVQNAVAYTGTHDNNTSRGWFRTDADKSTKKHIESYTGVSTDEINISNVLIKTLMASTAKITIIPIQDLLNLDESARINIPAVSEGNWTWRLTPNEIKPDLEKKLQKWTARYNRMS